MKNKMEKKEALPVLWTYEIPKHGFKLNWKKYSSYADDEYQTKNWRADILLSFTLQEQYKLVERYCFQRGWTIKPPIYAAVPSGPESEEEIDALFYEALQRSHEEECEIIFVNMGEGSLREGIIEADALEIKDHPLMSKCYSDHIDKIKQRCLVKISEYRRELPINTMQNLLSHSKSITMLNANFDLAGRFAASYERFLFEKTSKKRKPKRQYQKSRSKYKTTAPKGLSRKRTEYLDLYGDVIKAVFLLHKGQHQTQQLALEAIDIELKRALVPTQTGWDKKQDIFAHTNQGVSRLLKDLKILDDLMKP